VLVASLTASVGLSACGRKGPLEPPPKADVTSENPDQPGQSGKPDRGFPLDFLL